MPIFNSLGSNYNFSFALRALFARNKPKAFADLKEYLESKYGGKATLLYKAREAIFLALKTLDLPKDTPVAINGYTCYAVYQAVADAGLKPEYLDVVKGDLNFSADLFREALRKNPAIKVLVIQNTLGYPCDIAPLEEICKSQNIIIVEDLAHSVGSFYADGREAGTVGDFTVLSFSQDKMIDAVSGGALIVRNKNYQTNKLREAKQPGKKQQIKDRLYPMLTFKIRTSYAFGLGRIIHKLYAKMGLLSKPMGDMQKISLHSLPPWYCCLVLYQFKNLSDNIAHRREIAAVYARNVDLSLLFPAQTGEIARSSALRFPVMVESRNSLINYLKQFGIHVSDIWYDAPVAPVKLLSQTNYAGQCPKAQKLSDVMLNLPTHKNVSAAQAKVISQKINQWLKLQ